MTVDPKVQRIIDWRESFATLPDNHFFELIRMYLGEIKTPYNKQKLIEELGAFIRKEDNKKNLIALLDDDDLEVVAAVKFVSLPTQEKLASFFSGVYSYAALYEKVINLEERLVLYRYENKVSGKTLIGINPLLEELLDPMLSAERLIPQSVFLEKNEALPFTLNPQFLASFISFAFSHPEMCKADGAFKKRTVTELQQVYENSEQAVKVEHRLQLLAASFCNLGLFHENDVGIQIDERKLALFAELTPAVQYAYICVSSTGRFGWVSLETNTQLLLDVLASIPKTGYSRTALMRIGFIEQQKNNVRDGESGQMDCFIDSCVTFGILYSLGKNLQNEEVYGVSPLFTNQSSALPGDPKVLSIDAGFSVTLMPGLSLAQLIPLVTFMDVVRYDTAAVFEITKRSVMQAFDSGFTPDTIFSLLVSYSAYELSQNLRVSIDEWYRSYSSASLYKGYVLKVSEDKTVLAEKNPVLAPYIKQKLSSGIYLLSFTNDEEARTVFLKSGIDFIGNIKTCAEENEAVGFSKLQSHAIKISDDDSAVGNKQLPLINDADRKKMIAAFYKKLEEMNLTAEQKEGLADRIERKIIINDIQLRGTSVRFERLEASGMDYSGKLHVVDSAIANNCMIEIQGDDNSDTLVGTPLSLNKRTENAEVKVRLEPDHSIVDISIGAASRIKKIRATIKR